MRMGRFLAGVTVLGSALIMPLVHPAAARTAAQAGDCNGDAELGAADISSLVLEFFDGDGGLPASAAGGSFPGSPTGCDANADGLIDAGDLSFVVLMIFRPTGVVWSADHENGNLSQWNLNDSRATAQDSDTCIRPPSGVSTEHARSGSYAMKLTIDTSLGESGCRQFRYPEAMSGLPYYYSAWLLITEPTTVMDYWNVFQFKSKASDDVGSDPFWVLDLRNRDHNGALQVMLRWKGLVAGPFAGSGTASQTWAQTIEDVPIGQWFHLEVFLRQSGSAHDGRISVWQDGTLLFDLDQVKTRYDQIDQRWSINNYSNGLLPNPTTLYVDDAVISTERIGPTLP